MFRINYILVYFLLVSCSKSSSPAQSPVNPPVITPGRIINVSTAAQLSSALLNAQPGDDIIMANGLYKGKFVITSAVSGTSAKPITLRGSRNVVLDAENINTGYVLYLQANYWKIKGFTITNGLKGLMTDGANHNVIDSIKVFNIGEEAIHLRRFSSHNTIQFAEISNTGLKTPDYGEGIYIGSAESNWATYTNGIPDRCDSNKILHNKIGPNVTVESIDIKEGTTGGYIGYNNFDATGITGIHYGDSWIDAKGNYYLLENNTGFNPAGSALLDGYQVHVAVSGWGNYNVFKNNSSTVNATGFGFNIQLSGSNGTSTGNKVYTNNTVTGAASGIANIPLSN